MKVSDFFRCVLTLVFPNRCIICNNALPWMCDAAVCYDCRDKIKHVTSFPDRCKKCSRPIDENHLLCDACQIANRQCKAAYACFIYEGAMRTSVINYKYRKRVYYFRAYAEIMAKRLLAECDVSNFDAVVSVPSSKQRIKERSYDHTALIARRIAKICDLRYIPNGIIKIKDTPPQNKLTYTERFCSVKGAFAVNDKMDCEGKNILLIDDIYTTGATTDEISRILKEKSAANVTVLTLCITLGERKNKQ